MISQSMRFSLSLDLVSWRANLWAEKQRCPNENRDSGDGSSALPKPATDNGSGDQGVNDSDDAPSRFVRQPVRVVFTPRRPRT